MEAHRDESNQKCLIHILAKILMGFLDDNHGQVVQYQGKDFVVHKDGNDSSIIIDEISSQDHVLHSAICPEQYIRII